MATIRKRQSGKWQVIIRKKNYPSVVRSFLEKSTATKFAKDVETHMDKQIFQDLTGASTTTLKELMIKYRDEIVPTQKAHRSTTATLNMHMIFMDSDSKLAMNLGDIYFVTENANERLY